MTKSQYLLKSVILKLQNEKVGRDSPSGKNIRLTLLNYSGTWWGRCIREEIWRLVVLRDDDDDDDDDSRRLLKWIAKRLPVHYCCCLLACLVGGRRKSQNCAINIFTTENCPWSHDIIYQYATPEYIIYTSRMAYEWMDEWINEWMNILCGHERTNVDNLPHVSKNKIG